MLECTERQLKYTIENDDQLRAIYGARGFGAEVQAPSAGDVLLRKPGDKPEGLPSGDMNLGDIVSEQEMRIMHLGLKKMGASETLLKSLKGLDKLASSGGKFLAICLQTTHRMHFVQTLGTFELAARVKKILDDDDAEKDAAKKLSHEDRQDYYGLYLEMQASTGNAYNLTLKGTEAMVRMLMAATKRGFKAKAAAPGFGAIKSEDADGNESQG
jgi:hypothetical protein